MVDEKIALRPALVEAKRGRFGIKPDSTAALSLRARPQGHVLQVLGAAGCGDMRPALMQLGEGGPTAVRTSGPGQWLMVGASARSDAEIAELEASLGGMAVLVDQSHGRVRIAVCGEAVETVLAKGTGVDLCLAAFPIGRSVMTLLGPISIHMTRTDADAFEIIAPRSFAEHVWDDLIAMARDCGVLAL